MAFERARRASTPLRCHPRRGSAARWGSEGGGSEGGRKLDGWRDDDGEPGVGFVKGYGYTNLLSVVLSSSFFLFFFLFLIFLITVK